jgi:hypothetical protein
MNNRHQLFFRIRFLFLPILCFSFFSCVTLSPVGGAAEKPVAAASPEALVPRWQPFAGDAAGGLAYFSGRTAKPRLALWALRVDLASPDLRIVVRGGGGDAAGPALSTKVSSFVRDNGLLAGVNALPFDPVSGTEGEPRINIGIVVSDGAALSPPHPGYDALVWYADGGAPAIVSQAELPDAAIANAVGGFQRILASGEVTGRALRGTDRHPRSAAGISADGRFLYLLVIDGRRPGSVGSTEAETARALRALGAVEGINFDGGGSTSLVLRYPDGRVRPVNTPIHDLIPGRERAVAGCLGVGIK